VFASQALESDAWGWRSLMQLKNERLCILGGKREARDWLNSCRSGSKFSVQNCSLLFSEKREHALNGRWYGRTGVGIDIVTLHGLLVIADCLHETCSSRAGCPVDSTCVLCSGYNKDSCQPLFFECTYSHESWCFAELGQY